MHINCASCRVASCLVPISSYVHIFFKIEFKGDKRGDFPVKLKCHLFSNVCRCDAYIRFGFM